MNNHIENIKKMVTSSQFDFTLRELSILSALDIEYYKSKFEKDGFVVIPNFMKYDKALEIYNYLDQLDNWYYSFHWDDEQQIDILDNKDNQLDINYYSSLTDNVFLEKDILSYKFRKTNEHIMGCNCLECNYNKFFNSNYLKNIIKQITNIDINNLQEIFSSYYQEGDFLGKHSDSTKGQIAFVLNLTKSWDSRFGGNLHLLEGDWYNIKKTFVPTFNSFILFKVQNESNPHFVSQIIHGVPYKRFAVSGWYD